MLSKNNRNLLLKKQMNTKQRFAIKKLTVGVASVLIGLSFMGLSAHADTNDTANTQTLNVSQVQPASTQNLSQSAVQETTQNPQVPSNYASAMQGFRPDPGATNGQALVDASSQGIAENGGSQTTGFDNATYSQTGSQVTLNIPGNYQHSAADQAESVDMNNLTDAQRYEMAQFSAQVINQIRSKVQAQPNGTSVSAGYVRVSPYASQLGQNMVNSAYATEQPMTHNEDGLRNYANGQGLATNYVGENIASKLLAEQVIGTNLNMDQIKQSIYAALLSMMYFDNNDNGVGAGGHTTAILNDPYYNSNTTAGGNAIALSRTGQLIGNQYLTVSIDGLHQIHFNFISDANASQDVKNRLAANSTTPGVTDPGLINFDNSGQTVVANANYGNLDGYTVSDAGNGMVNIAVTGWQAADASRSEQNRFLILYDRTTNREIARVAATTVARPDVYNVYSNVYNSENAGFTGTFNVNASYLNDQLCVVSRYSDATNGEGNHTDYWSGNLNINNGNLGSLDEMQIVNGKLVVSGWHANNAALNKPTHMIILYDQTKNHELARVSVSDGQRADVANVYPTVANAAESGFSTSFDLMPEYASDNIQIVSRWTGSKDGNSDYVDYWFPAKRLIADDGNYGNFDGLSLNGDSLTVNGWHASNQALGKKYHYIIVWDQNLGHEIARQLVSDGASREDVAKAYPNVLDAANSGFSTTFKLSSEMANDNLQFISRWTDDPAGNGSNTTDYWFTPAGLDHTNRANLDSFNVTNGNIQVTGWHAANAAFGKKYHYVILLDKTTGKELARQLVTTDNSRPDVKQAFPTIYNADQSGFDVNFKLDTTKLSGHQLQVVSRWTDDPAGNGSNTTDFWFNPETIA